MLDEPHVNMKQNSLIVKLNETLEQSLENGDLKAKHHPGLRDHKIVSVPETAETSLFSLIGSMI